MPSRRQFLVTAAAALTGETLAGRQRLPQPVATSRFHDVRRGVGYFTGPGGTIGWLATPDGAAVIDTQFPETAKLCVDELRNRSARGIEVLINTHHHGDHTAGNTTFRPAVRQIVQHERCAMMHRAAAQAIGGDAQKGLADSTFTDSWSTTIGTERIAVSYYGPAHTGGDAVVLFEQANVVHLGDLVFNRMPPFVDRPSGASIRSWIAILERIAAEHANATFIFGHGKNDVVSGTAKDVTHFKDYLTAVLDYVQKGITAGRSLQEIASLDVLPGFPDHMNIAKTYTSPVPVFTLTHVLTAMYEELTTPQGPAR